MFVESDYFGVLMERMRERCFDVLLLWRYKTQTKLNTTKCPLYSE